MSSPTPTPASSAAIAIDASPVPDEDFCKSEKNMTAIVGGVLGGILGPAVVALIGIVFWMSKREQRQRRLKEHYEEQFAQTWAYRKAMAASMTSVKSDVHEEITTKSSGS